MTSSADDISTHGFDPDVLRNKYRDERDKRLRKDGTAQYIDVSGDFAGYAVDPYVTPGFQRNPVVEDTDALVLGGGLAGLMTAVNLKKAGIKAFRIVEQAGGFGGAWYWNRYPGIRCDIESYIYIPMLEEVDTVPSEKYARGEEILAHCQRLATKFGLYELALFQTEITSIVWDEPACRWIVRTNRGDIIRSRHVMVSTGPLNRPKLPGIPGISDFRGHAFHTSRWDYDYTKGTSAGNLEGLRGQKVALIGTGATGIQVLPHLAASAEQVYVFQRTPSSVDKRNNRPTDVAWFKSLPPGWQQARMDNFMLTVMGIPQAENLVNDCWTDISTLNASFSTEGSAASAEELAQLVDFTKMEQIRARIDEVVQDPAVAQALKPWYNIFCKRPLFSDEYLPTFNRPNVKLVDTQGRGVDRVTETALEFDGRTYPVDCIVYATGFMAGAYTHESGGYKLIGRDGLSLKQKWADGVRSVHGSQMSHFPNFHIIGAQAQAAVTFNYPHVTFYEARHAARLVARCLERGVRSMEVTPEAEQRWQEEMESKSYDNAKFQMECTPGFYNNEGKTDGRKSLFSSFYDAGPVTFIETLEQWYSKDYERDLKIKS